MNLKLVKCNSKKKWDYFVNQSSQGNIFCSTLFLDSIKVDYELYFVEEKLTPHLGAIVLKQNNQPIVAPYPFTMYQGLLFSGFSQAFPIHKKIKWGLTVCNFLLAEMEKKYKMISFCLHYNTGDLRSFRWFNYHEPEKGQFKINLNYTGLIKLKEYFNFHDYFMDIRPTRKYEFRKAREHKLTIEKSEDIEKFDYLHRLTFERQGLKRTAQERKILVSICQSVISKKCGDLLLCKNIQGEAISATLFLYDEHCGYYLFGANNPQYRQTFSGTYLMLENIKRCFDKKLALVDVCGINSPNRGDFKTSLNAVPTPYFEVTWKKNE